MSQDQHHHVHPFTNSVHHHPHYLHVKHFFPIIAGVVVAAGIVAVCVWAYLQDPPKPKWPTVQNGESENDGVQGNENNT